MSFQNGTLHIHAPNSTLADVLLAVRAATGASIEVPAAARTERVITDLGPGPARDVLAHLLNGSRFDYVILGSSDGTQPLQRVLLMTKANPSSATAEGAGATGAPPVFRPAPPTEETVEEEQLPEAVPVPPAQGQMPQAAPPPSQPPAKTPEQLLRELQQLQQQQGVPAQQQQQLPPPAPPQVQAPPQSQQPQYLERRMPPDQEEPR